MATRRDHGSFIALTSRAARLRRLVQRPQFPATEKDLGHFGLQLQLPAARRDVECFVHFDAVDEGDNMIAVACYVEPRPLAVRTVDVLGPAKSLRVGPVRSRPNQLTRWSVLPANVSRWPPAFQIGSPSRSRSTSQVSERAQACRRHLCPNGHKIADAAFDDLHFDRRHPGAVVPASAPLLCTSRPESRAASVRPCQVRSPHLNSSTKW